MDFTYREYQYLISLLRENDYRICSYQKALSTNDKVVVLRHDIDNSLQKALELAKLEQKLSVHSIYFVLLTSDFYNVASKKSKDILCEIQDCGHELGLHFDETVYEYERNTKSHILQEIDILSLILNKKIQLVSMHRPSKETLNADYSFDGVINSYGKTFFSEFKYLSDSRMHWREDVFSIIQNQEFSKLHILTHPIWYDECELTTRSKLETFIKHANLERYNILEKNFRDLNEFVTTGDIV